MYYFQYFPPPKKNKGEYSRIPLLNKLLPKNQSKTLITKNQPNKITFSYILP